MNNKVKCFFSSFVLTLIFIGALCGFAAVDLSTDRYMPGSFGAFFEISKISPEAVDFSFLSNGYALNTKMPEDLQALIKKYRGLLPVQPQIFSSLTAKAVEFIMNSV